MKKTILILLLTTLLAGCGKNAEKNSDAEDSAKTFHETILKLEHTTLPSSSLNFDIDWSAKLNNSGSYRYTVTISNPRMAMCSVKAMAVIDGAYGDISATSSMPKVGIDGDTFNLYPNQVNEAADCYDKIELIINTNEKEIWVSVVVEWKNKEGSKSFREYLSKLVTYSEAVEQ